MAAPSATRVAAASHGTNSDQEARLGVAAVEAKVSPVTAPRQCTAACARHLLTERPDAAPCAAACRALCTTARESPGLFSALP